jgi:ferredoxin/flavodoxin---NADP+ reductase
MFEIRKKKLVAPDIYYMDVYAPRIAKAAMPGQFLIVRVDENGERVPLTISDYDVEEGTIAIVTQALGASTRKIVALNEGDSFANFAGPLGIPSELVHMLPEELAKLKVLFVAGGVGAAPVYPQVKFMFRHGAKADVVLGARSSELVIYRDELAKVSKRLFVATNDGSEGTKGFVTDVMSDLMEKHGEHYDMVVCIGPMIMMKAVTDFTRKLNIKTIASLNTLMVDGTGMCGACRVTVGGKTKFTCVDGPEFDAHQVDFDEAMRRTGMYKSIEKQKLEDDHDCRIGLGKN